jgi:uridine kinase
LCSPDPRLIDSIVAVVDRCRAEHPVVLIDGPSGAGKSTLASALVQHWPRQAAPQLVRLDDVYPGWEGLDAAAEQVVTRMLEPLRGQGTGSWQRWDWATQSAGEWHPLTAQQGLVIEGCGALSRASAPLADVTVWVEADDSVRKRRALERDAGGFDAHWDMWQEQFDRFTAREHPRRRALLVLENSASPGEDGVPRATVGP